MLPRKKRTNWESHITDVQTAEKEDIEKRRERNRLRMRQVRALENEEEADRRREKNKLHMRQVRALENEVEAERRREKNKLRMRQVRAIEKMDSERNMDYSASNISLVCTTEMASGETYNEDDSETKIKQEIPGGPCNRTNNVSQP
jgi:hypothetical protein